MINEGSAWIIEYINREYLNISIHNPLSGSTYIKLLDKLKNTMKGLINIKNNDNTCFIWCYIRHLNTLDKNLQIITKADKRMVNDLDYKGINFPFCKKDYSKIEKKNNTCITVSRYENDLVYRVYICKQKFEDHKIIWIYCW